MHQEVRLRRTDTGSSRRRAGSERGARRAVDARGLERRVVVEVGQKARQAAGEHRLAGARRTDEEHVMSAGGGDFEREPRQWLPPDIDEVGQGWRRRIGWTTRRI